MAERCISCLLVVHILKVHAERLEYKSGLDELDVEAHPGTDIEAWGQPTSYLTAQLTSTSGLDGETYKYYTAWPGYFPHYYRILGRYDYTTRAGKATGDVEMGWPGAGFALELTGEKCTVTQRKRGVVAQFGTPRTGSGGHHFGIAVFKKTPTKVLHLIGPYEVGGTNSFDTWCWQCLEKTNHIKDSWCAGANKSDRNSESYEFGPPMYTFICDTIMNSETTTNGREVIQDGNHLYLVGAVSHAFKRATGSPGPEDEVLHKRLQVTVANNALMRLQSSDWHIEPNEVMYVTKLTEAYSSFGQVTTNNVVLERIYVPKDCELATFREPTRHVEYFGDSDSSGFGVWGCGKSWISSGMPNWRLSDHRETWAYRVTKALAAEAHVQAISGIGVHRCPDGASKCPAFALPSKIDLALPSQTPDSNHPAPIWNKDVWMPNAVVILLGANDFFPGDGGMAWLTGWVLESKMRPDAGTGVHAQYYTFQKAYQKFIQAIHAMYLSPYEGPGYVRTSPPIFVVCGGSGSWMTDNDGLWFHILCNNIKHAVDALDSSIRVHVIDGLLPHLTALYGDMDNNVGCFDHFRWPGHERIANFVSELISNKLGWALVNANGTQGIASPLPS